MTSPQTPQLKINEIFYSLQGEGHWTGTPAIFVRLAGCNLACPFCDTVHQPFTLMDYDGVLSAIAAAAPAEARHVVITGGEPALQLTEAFIDRLHRHGYIIHLETNGTIPLPAPVDWLTCSPKEGAPVRVTDIDELKVVFTSPGFDPEPLHDAIPAREYYLQPCDTGNPQLNAEITAATIAHIKSHPNWRLSLQTHKLLNIQ